MMSNKSFTGLAWVMGRTGAILFSAAALVAGCAVFALGSFARADDKATSDPLSGPRVTDRSVPGESGSFGSARADRKDRPIPHPVFLRAVLSLNAPDAPAGVRATPELAEDLREIEKGFREDVKAYMELHKDEIMDIRGKLGGKERQRFEQFMRGAKDGARSDGPRPREPGSDRSPEDNADGADGLLNSRPGGRADGARRKGPRGGPRGEHGVPDMMPDEEGVRENAPKVSEQERAAAVEQAKTLLDNAPKPADTHAAMTALLSDPQKKYVTEQLEERMAQMKGQARDRLEGQPMGDDNAGPAALRRPWKAGQAAPRTPEERKKLREALRKRMEERRSAGQSAGQNGQSVSGTDDEK